MQDQVSNQRVSFALVLMRSTFYSSWRFRKDLIGKTQSTPYLHELLDVSTFKQRKNHQLISVVLYLFLFNFILPESPFFPLLFIYKRHNGRKQ